MADSSQFQPVVTTNLTATIANGATESGAIDLSGTTLAGIVFPAEFDGTAVTLKAATAASGTYLPVHDINGLAVTVTGAASRIALIEPAKIAGLQHMKLVAGTAQTGATTFTLLTRPV